MLSVPACKLKDANIPVWINESNVVTLPRDSFFFKTKNKNWDASLLSFTQPIPLSFRETNDGFVLTLKSKTGVIEGPGLLRLSNGKQQVYYELNLRNESFGFISHKDYRSPKTVNTDSSRQQQRIVHSIDQWRNIISAYPTSGYFAEDRFTLQPVAGVFYAQKEKPISAFYIQPGSAISITVHSIYHAAENIFVVTAGELKDEYNNIVANGTVVVFLYNDGEINYRMEAFAVNGFATVKIPALNKNYILTANVNQTVSSPVQLNAR